MNSGCRAIALSPYGTHLLKAVLKASELSGPFYRSLLISWKKEEEAGCRRQNYKIDEMWFMDFSVFCGFFPCNVLELLYTS